MNNILIISGHPDLEHSTANRRIIERVQTAFPQTVVRRLDTLYPDGAIDAAAHLCGMNYQAPVYSYNMAYLPGISSEADLVGIRSRADAHAEELIARIRAALAS